MKSFIEWLQKRILEVTSFADHGTATGFFNDIVANPTDMTSYLIAADFLEDQGLPEFAVLIRLCIQYRQLAGKAKAAITRRMGQLFQQNAAIFDKIEGLTHNPKIKQQIYMLHVQGDEANKPWAYTYDSMRDRRNWDNDKTPARFQNHPEPDSPFVNSQFSKSITGKTIDTFPPQIIAAMIFYILLANNKDIVAAIQSSKALSNMKPLRTLISTHHDRSPDQVP